MHLKQYAHSIVHIAKSPGPIYGRVESFRTKSNVVMKEDAHTVDESRRWGKRDSWIGGAFLHPILVLYIFKYVNRWHVNPNACLN